MERKVLKSIAAASLVYSLGQWNWVADVID